MELYTIIEESTGRVLFAKFDNEVEEGQVAVTELCTERYVQAFFDFKTRTFYGEIDNTEVE